MRWIVGGVSRGHWEEGSGEGRIFYVGWRRFLAEKSAYTTEDFEVWVYTVEWPEFGTGTNQKGQETRKQLDMSET